jgi:hypothetical protein
VCRKVAGWGELAKARCAKQEARNSRMEFVSGAARPTNWSAQLANQSALQHLLRYYWASAFCSSAVLRTLYSSFISAKQTETRLAIRLDTPASEIPSALSDADHCDSA